jgi:type II secretory pathway pseudopilin PulG
MLKKIWKGFSWIEIGTALLLFALVVVLTLPSFSRFQCLSRQSEVKFELLRILAAATLYKTEHAHFPTMDQLMESGRVKLLKAHYSYEIALSQDGTKIWVTGFGKPESKVAGDKWRIDMSKNLESLHDVCERPN